MTNGSMMFKLRRMIYDDGDDNGSPLPQGPVLTVKFSRRGDLFASGGCDSEVSRVKSSHRIISNRTAARSRFTFSR